MSTSIAGSTRLATSLGELALWAQSRAWARVPLEPLPYVELLVLQTVMSRPGSTVTDIAHLLDKQSSNISTAVGALVQRGLIERHRDETDARRLRLFPSPKAIADRQASADAVADSLAPAVQVLSAGERRDLGRILAKLLPALQS